MRYTIAILVLFLFAAGCSHTNSPNPTAPTGGTQGGVGSIYTFNETKQAAGEVVFDTVTWTEAADNLTIYGESSARLMVITSSASSASQSSDSIYLVDLADGDLLFHRNLTNGNATWVRLPTSGDNGELQVLQDTIIGGLPMYLSSQTTFLGAATVPTAKGSISTQEVVSVTTTSDTLGGVAIVNIESDTMWYATSIGCAAKEVAGSTNSFSGIASSDSLYMTGYTLK